MAKTSGQARKAPSASSAKRPAGAKTPAKKGRTPVKAAKPAAKTTTKPASAKKSPPAKKTTPARPPASPAPAAKTAKARTGPKISDNGKKTAAKPAPQASAAAKPARKGITVVTPKPSPRKARGKPAAARVPTPPPPGSLGALIGKPLIPSGPNAPAPNSLTLGSGSGGPKKSPFTKKQLERFREILLRKRAELAGDVSAMESEALRGNSGQLSHLPQHMAEQGSDTYDQALSLDLAAADRRLIREIDDALGRIDAGTYGVCELTGKPIRPERLEELPWARYSIEAARELERRSNVL